jgi:hypothetical protein
MSVLSPSLEKLNDTIQKLRDMVSKMDTYSQAELNRAEDKIRNEFQVIEAAIAYVGRDIYSIAQNRRLELRNQNIAKVRDAIKAISSDKNENKETEKNGSGDSNANGNSGDGNGTNKPRRSKSKSDKQTSESTRQS